MEGVVSVSPSGDRQHLLALAHPCRRRILQIRGPHHWNQIKPIIAGASVYTGRPLQVRLGQCWQGFRVVAAEWCKELPVSRRQHQRYVNFRRNCGCHCLETPSELGFSNTLLSIGLLWCHARMATVPSCKNVKCHRPHPIRAGHITSRNLVR
jgi:hypothetical protein